MPPPEPPHGAEGVEGLLPEGVSIRPATPADAEALAHLHLDVWDDAYTGLMSQSILDERRANVADRVTRWRTILDEHDRTLLAQGPGGPDDLVGFAGAGPGRDNDVDTDLELQALYVRQRWWGRGIGHALLRAAVGDRAAYLWVLHDDDRAVAFYRRQGFYLDGTEDEHDDGRHVRMVRTGT